MEQNVTEIEDLIVYPETDEENNVHDYCFDKPKYRFISSAHLLQYP